MRRCHSRDIYLCGFLGEDAGRESQKETEKLASEQQGLGDKQGISE